MIHLCVVSEGESTDSSVNKYLQNKMKNARVKMFKLILKDIAQKTNASAFGIHYGFQLG